MARSFSIGIDIGGTEIKGALFDSDSGECLDRRTTLTRDGERMNDVLAWAAGTLEMVSHFEDRAGKKSIPVGIAAPGLATRDGSRIAFMPGRIGELAGFDWSQFLQREVRILNDAHAALLGEVWQGIGKGLRDVVLLTIGTGVGGAAMCGGRLLHGHLGRAGHLGHISLDPLGALDIANTPGSLEDAIGNASLQRRSEGRFKMTRDLLDALLHGDAFAEGIWDDSVRSLAAGIASLINCFDPECVILGGGIAAGARDHLFEPLEQWLEKFEWRPGGGRVRLMAAALGEWAGSHGAAWNRIHPQPADLMVLAHFFHLFTDVCLPIFVSVGLGWTLDRRFHLHLESLVKLNIYLMVPAFIFTRVFGTELSGHDSLKIVAFAASTIASMFLCSFVVGRRLQLAAAQKQALSLATMFYNCGNFGIPLVTLAFGAQGAAVQVYMLATMNVATFTVGLFLAQRRGESPGSHWRVLMKVLRQPTLYAVAAGALCRGFGWPVNEVKWIWQPLDLLASGLIGFALVTLGVQMSQTKPAPFQAPLWSAISIRLVLGPLLAVALAWLFQFSPVVAASLILATGAPTAVNTALLAHEFGGDVSFATSAVYYSTLISLLTTTINLALLRYWLGQ